jgi:hypothetical protein
MVRVMVAESDAGALSGTGTNVEVSQVIVRTSGGVCAGRSAGIGMVTIKPVSSTVGETAGSDDMTLKFVPTGKAVPEGSMVPVKTRVLPGTAGSMGFS